jgi:hypothetical protein
MDAIAKPQCQRCGEPLAGKGRGRPQKFCSDRCRQAHRKIAIRLENGPRYRTSRVGPKSAAQAAELLSEFKPENLCSNISPLRCERVNNSTFKITDGDLTNLPASHGQWSGYRTTKGLAWIIKLGSGAWLARCGDQACGPSSFSEARANAVAMAKGAGGDYCIQNPVAHLNGLQALLESREPGSASPQGAKLTQGAESCGDAEQPATCDIEGRDK